MDCFQAFLVDVSVDLGRGDIGMAEEFLNDPQICAVFEEVSREGMAEQVRVDVLIDAGLFGPFFHNLADSIGRERSASNRDEDFGGGLSGDQSRAFVGQVALQSFKSATANRNQAGFVAFSGDAKELVLEVEMFQSRRADFGEPETRGVEKFEDGEITSTQLFGGIDGGEKLIDGLGVEGFREFGGCFGGENRLGWVDFDHVALLEEAEEDLEVDKGDPQ